MKTKEPIEKILVAYSQGTYESSRSDLKALFEEQSEQLFSQPDVGEITPFTNLSGLNPKQTTVVIPGGYAPSIITEWDRKKKELVQLFAQGSNGVFICAGGYLAANEVRLGRKEQGIVTLIEPIQDYSLGLNTNFTALGPFYPNYAYNEDEPTYPHSAKLKSSVYSLNARQIYWQGCGFIPNHRADSLEFEVVASYGDNSCYIFKNQTYNRHAQVDAPPVAYTNLAAIMRKKSSASTGGFFASGVHIEAGVQHSKLLKEVQSKLSNYQAANMASFFKPEQALQEVLPILADSITRKF